MANGANGANGANRANGADRAKGAKGPKGLKGPIGPCSPIGRKGGSLAHTSSLARVEANLNLSAALSAKGHTN